MIEGRRYVVALVVVSAVFRRAMGSAADLTLTELEGKASEKTLLWTIDRSTALKDAMLLPDDASLQWQHVCRLVASCEAVRQLFLLGPSPVVQHAIYLCYPLAVRLLDGDLPYFPTPSYVCRYLSFDCPLVPYADEEPTVALLSFPLDELQCARNTFGSKRISGKQYTLTAILHSVRLRWLLGRSDIEVNLLAKTVWDLTLPAQVAHLRSGALDSPDRRSIDAAR